MKRIKIAYICTPIDFGGAEKVSLNFLRSVDRERFDITPILLIRPWEPLPYFANQLIMHNFNCVTVPVAQTPNGGPSRVLRVAWKLFSLLRQGRYDLVHTHGYFADICAIPCARLAGMKSVVTCHGFISNDRKLRLYNRLDKLLIRLSTVIIVVSEGIGEELLRSGITDKQIRVVPNGVPAGPDRLRSKHLRQETRSALKLSGDEFVVGYLGRLSEEKGVNYLVEAVARLKGQGAAVKLLLVGDGPSRRALEELSHARLGNGHVVFAGFQENTEQWLTAMDVFALPSLTEGTPMALLEAMAAQVPIVASAVGGVPKVIKDGKNGLLVPPGDVAELASALARLLAGDELGLRLAANAVHDVERDYGLDVWRKQYEEIYEHSVLA